VVLPAESEQELLDRLPPVVSEVKVTAPVGGVGLVAVSVTMAVHDVAWPMATVPGCSSGSWWWDPAAALSGSRSQPVRRT
jgi:hypothetical protein